MAEVEGVQPDNHDALKKERLLPISEYDLEYVVRQLELAVKRASSGERMGTHLIKRLRRSKGILLSIKEKKSEEGYVLLQKIQESTQVVPRPLSERILKFLRNIVP